MIIWLCAKGEGWQYVSSFSSIVELRAGGGPGRNQLVIVIIYWSSLVYSCAKTYHQLEVKFQQNDQVTEDLRHKQIVMARKESFGDCYYVLIIIGFILCQTLSYKKNAGFKKINSNFVILFVQLMLHQSCIFLMYFVFLMLFVDSWDLISELKLELAKYYKDSKMTAFISERSRNSK